MTTDHQGVSDRYAVTSSDDLLCLAADRKQSHGDGPTSFGRRTSEKGTGPPRCNREV